MKESIKEGINMVHSSIHWNISSEKGFHLIHNSMIEILNEQPKKMMKLNEFVYLLNSRTKHHKIHNNKRHNCITKYIRSNYGGIQKFIDDYSIYGISNKGGETYVHLLEKEMKDFDINEIHRRITKDCDWIFI